MKRLPILVVALIVAVIATAVAAVGVVSAHRDDETGTHMGSGLMNSGSKTTPEGRDHSRNPTMRAPLMMGSHASASEPEYLGDMMAHHREAVAAARELARSDRPQMRALGESIVHTQSAQIEQMLTWVSEWYPEQSTRVDYRPMMRDLWDLAGDRLDRVFLQDMIGHHMTAVMMSQNLLSRDTDHEEVAVLARSIRDDQHTEIIQMQHWLTQWFDTRWHGTAMGRGMWSDQGSDWGIGPSMMRGSTS